MKGDAIKTHELQSSWKFSMMDVLAAELQGSEWTHHVPEMLAVS